MNMSLRMVVSAAVCSAMLFNGCAKNESTKGKQLLFGMVPKGVHPYYVPCYEGFKDAGAKYGVKTEYVASEKFEIPQQVQMIESVIARHVDGIALSALDDQGLVKVIAEATKAGIKVITFDAPAPSSGAQCYIGTANEVAGYTSGEEIARLLNNEGEVAVLQGGLAAPNLNDRYKGFERALKEKAPRIKIVAREDTQGLAKNTADKMEAILQAHPNLKAVFGVSAEGVPGALSVLKDQKKTDAVILAGFDDLKDTLEGIRAGTVKFCIVQRTYKMGWLSVEKLLDATKGKDLEQQIDTGVLIVTKDNVDTYMRDMKKEFEK